MHIEHIALWTNDLKRLKTFYETHFAAAANSQYINPAKGFASYFLTFTNGARLELMSKEGLRAAAAAPATGYAHFALSTGSVEAVNRLTEQLRQAGVPIVDGPRWTGDGYYQQIIARKTITKIIELRFEIGHINILFLQFHQLFLIVTC